jgi:CCR4-NOT transcription complex subunit 6
MNAKERTDATQNKAGATGRERASSVEGDDAILRTSARKPPTEPAVVRVELLHTRTPVEGCEMTPFVLLRDVNGDQRTAEAMEARTKGVLSAQYRWYRREHRFTCAKTGLPAQFECLELGRVCAELERLGDSSALNLSSLAYVHEVSEMREIWPTMRELWRRVLLLRQKRPREDASILGRGTNRLDHDREAALYCEMPPENDSKLVECGFVRNYAPTVVDIGRTLLLECRYMWKIPNEEVRVGPPVYLETLPAIRFTQPPPERRMFLVADTNCDYSVKDRARSGELNSFPLRLLSYNCLAEIYANSDLYSYCPDWALAWNYRRRNLLREILSLEADVVCLQEVQADHFEEHFNPAMRRAGFEGIYKAKMRESMGRKGKVDGCATFYRRDRFRLLEKHEIEYSTIAREKVKEKRLLNRLMKDNVALLIVLEDLATGSRVCVANTHIFWDPDQTDVKLFQVDTFLQEAEAYVGARNIPLLIAGDFNSLPESSIYELIVRNEVSGQRPDVIDGMLEILKISPCQHNLLLRSVYGIGGEFTEPSYTNYTGHFVGTLDFIFFTPESIVPVGTLEILDEARLLGDEFTALPNPRWSSDHIAIMADFDIRGLHQSQASTAWG